MHADVIGAKDDTCGKCGMTLDQLVVLVPPRPARSMPCAPRSRQTRRSRPGSRRTRSSNCAAATNEPVTPAELIETHTRKIHLLVIDGSLTDYHHEHPQPAATPGDYVFDFTPAKPGPYLAWADLRPLPMGLQEYEKAIIAGAGNFRAVTDKEAAPERRRGWIAFRADPGAGANESGRSGCRRSCGLRSRMGAASISWSR